MSEAQPWLKHGISPQPANATPAIVGIARTARSGLIPRARMERYPVDRFIAARRIQAMVTATVIIPRDVPLALIEIEMTDRGWIARPLGSCELFWIRPIHVVRPGGASRNSPVETICAAHHRCSAITAGLATATQTS